MPPLAAGRQVAGRDGVGEDELQSGAKGFEVERADIRARRETWTYQNVNNEATKAEVTSSDRRAGQRWCDEGPVFRQRVQQQ